MLDKTCFLIDDDADDREIFMLALEEADPEYKCITAINGVDALKKLDADEALMPDYIFLDLNMPMLSGTECLKEIKKITRLSEVPVIMYSTSSLDKDFEEARAFGAKHFLVKPPSLLTLKTILSQLITEKDLPFFLGLKR